MIGAKHIPGYAFLFFLQEKTLQRVMLGRDGRNAKAFALRCGHTKITRCQQKVQVYFSCYVCFFSVSACSSLCLGPHGFIEPFRDVNEQA